MQQLNLENLYILCRAGVKLIGIWWPYMVVAAILSYRLYREEKRAEEMEVVECETSKTL